MKKRIIVVEDHDVLRQGIIETIDREIDLVVCGQADDVATALAIAGTAGADLVLIDLQLKASSGIDLIRQLRRRHPALPTVAMTMFDQERCEKLARAAGANGFASKQAGPDMLLESIRAALTGHRPQPPHLP
ncbi:MAG: response regulator transcription factor [Opitutaceae bacterium]|nr:response regulator transcription factor [Opitutaceae bacterium]